LVIFAITKLIDMENVNYKIKSKYKAHLLKYAWTKLDLNSEYSLEEWTKAGFKKSVLEKC